MTRYCPFCGTQMGEDAPKGELAGTFTCPTCRQEVDYAPPGTGPYPFDIDAPNPAPNIDAPAWEGDTGLLARLWATIWQMLLRPMRTLGSPGQKDIVWPLSFGIILGTLGGAAQIFWGRALGWSGFSSGNEIWWLIIQPLSILVSLFLISGVIHFMLWVLRGAHQGFKATFRTAGYGQASNIFLLLPWLGMPLSLIWGLVIFIGGLAAAQGTSKTRAFWATFLPIIIIIFVLLAIGMAVGIGMLMGLLKDAGRQGLLPL